MNLFASIFDHQPVAPVSSVRFDLMKATYTYPDGHVGLKPTDLSVTPEDGNVAILGLNGSGKSTLLNVMCGNVAPTSGSVLVSGDGMQYNTSSHGARKNVKRMVGKMDHADLESVFASGVSIQEGFLNYLKKHHVNGQESFIRVGNLFEHFDLRMVSRAPIDALDGEQLHLLRLALSLSLDPGVLLADEPTKGLDEISTAHVAQRLFSYPKQVVFATHEVDLVSRPEYNIKRVLLLDEQAVLFSGAPEAATQRYTELIREKYREMSTNNQ